MPALFSSHRKDPFPPIRDPLSRPVFTKLGDSSKSLIVHNFFIDTYIEYRYNVSVLTVVSATTEQRRDGSWNERDLWDMNFAPYPI